MKIHWKKPMFHYGMGDRLGDEYNAIYISNDPRDSEYSIVSYLNEKTPRNNQLCKRNIDHPIIFIDELYIRQRLRAQEFLRECDKINDPKLYKKHYEAEIEFEKEYNVYKEIFG